MNAYNLQYISITYHLPRPYQDMLANIFQRDIHYHDWLK